MPSVKTFNLAHLPPEIAINVCLFKDVKNASFLRQQLLSGNTDFEYAFIDATTILSTTHVLAAAFRAINDLRANRLKSRNVHSETVFSLSINNNIAESFRRFGISDTTTSLLCIKISAPTSSATSHDSRITPESVQAHLSSNVHGQQLDFCDESLQGLRDLGKIRKTYKVGEGIGGCSDGGPGAKKAAGKRIQKAQATNSAQGIDAGANNATGKEKGNDEVETAEGVKEGTEKGAKGRAELDEKGIKEMEIVILGMMALKGS